MTKQVDKDQNFIKNQWETEYLASEYGWEDKIEPQKMLREITNDLLTFIKVPHVDLNTQEF